jgi:hypothetical protein
MSRFVKTRILEIEVVSEAVAETADIVVCALWSWPGFAADDVRGACGLCTVPIRFRPHAPKRPVKVCMVCAPEWLEATRH